MQHFFFQNCIFVFSFSVLWRKCWMCRPWSIYHSSVSVEAVTSVLFTNVVLLLCPLKLSGGCCTWAAQALLQHMGVCGLYPLVVILFRFNDLKAKFLVKVNGWLIADLHVTVGKEKRKTVSYITIRGRWLDIEKIDFFFLSQGLEQSIIWVTLVQKV